MNVRGFIFKKLIMPVGDVLTRQRVLYLYNYYSRMQWLERGELLNIQDNNLKSVINFAYSEVPFFKEFYDAHGVEVNKIKGASDLHRLPVLTKKNILSSSSDSCARKSRWPVTECFTSGSSGQPFAVKIDNLTHSHARALMFLRAELSGWKIGDPYLQFGMTGRRGIVKGIKDIALGCKYFLANDLTDTHLDNCLDILDNKNIKFIMGYPGSIYYLAKRAQKQGVSCKMKGVVTWGDNLHNFYRTTIESLFGCRVTDSYGCGEGIQIAAQCIEGKYHIFMPHVLVEVVDSQGNPVTPGEVGNILLTRLDAGVMPLVRYKVGDIGRMGHIGKCRCGRSLDVLDSIDGRDSDVILTPNGNRLIVHFFTGIFEYYSSVDTFRIIQDRPGAITVEIVPLPDFKPAHWDQIKAEILEKGDPDLEIEMILVNDIAPEASNKRRFVISRLEDQKRESDATE